MEGFWFINNRNAHDLFGKEGLAYPSANLILFEFSLLAGKEEGK